MPAQDGSRTATVPTLTSLVDHAIPLLFLFLLLMWRRVKRRVPVSTVTALFAAGLVGSILPLLEEAWQQEVDQRTPALARAALLLVTAVATSQVPIVSRLAGQPVTFDADDPTLAPTLTALLVHHLTLVGQTTLMPLRRLLEEGFPPGMTPGQQAQLLRDVVGLTPTQQETALRRPGDERTAWIQEALQRRAALIAVTLAHALAILGQRLVVEQAIQQGLVPVDAVRRFWQVKPGACAVCAAIPGMNPAGVGLYELFQTPSGPVMEPGLHPMCRCELQYRKA